MTASVTSSSRFNLFQGILPVDRANLTKDMLAGVTLAALGIPEVMGYTRIAQTPVITGLYTLVLPVIVFAIFGSSRHLVVAADSATAAVLAGALVHYAAPYSQQWVSLTAVIALLSAGMLIVARIFRLGLLADFLSRSALIGFLTGVGIQVAGGEFGSLLGIPGQGHNTFEQVLYPFRHLMEFQPWIALVAFSVLGVVLILDRVAPRFPGALLAVIGSIVASAMLGLERHGVATIGSVPGGLPHLTFPHVSWPLAAPLLTTAASCTIIIIAQSAATSRSYAMRYNDTFSENRDMVGLALANVAAPLTGTFIVNGSPTKAEMVDMAGGRSQIAQLTTSAIIVLVLLFLTRQLSMMPAVVLSAVVFLIGVRLIDLRGMQDLYRLRRDEFWIATVTGLTVALVGVEQGILLAIAISLIDHLRVSYHPPSSLLKLSNTGEIIPAPISSDEMAMPGLMVYRFEAPLYYANADYFLSQVLQLIHHCDTQLRWFVVRFDSISDVDYSASKMLLNLIQRLKGSSSILVFSDIDARMKGIMERYGVTEALGSDKMFADAMSALQAYKRLSEEVKPSRG